MRTTVRIGLALLMALACSTTAAAQTADRVSLAASVGPSFANVGTTFSTTANLDVRLHDRVSLAGEVGVLPRAPFTEAASIAPPVPGTTGSAKVNAYHWNGNVVYRPFDVGRAAPYVTTGLGSFTADTIVGEQRVDGRVFEDRRRVTDLAANVGAGLTYRLTDWIGIGGDYRTFFVYRDGSTPRVHRVTAGLSLYLK